MALPKSESPMTAPAQRTLKAMYLIPKPDQPDNPKWLWDCKMIYRTLHEYYAPGDKTVMTVTSLQNSCLTTKEKLKIGLWVE